MTKSGNYAVLNRLLTILQRSLPSYLIDASPWMCRGDEKALDALHRIAADQMQIAGRITNHVMDEYGRVELGDYPLDFPDTNDLAFDYLLGKLVVCQRLDVAAIESCVSELQGDRVASALAEEALGAARGHLETLEELASEAAKAGATWVKR